MTIGDKIQFYRKKLGMSQEELGQKLFVSRQTVSLWEKGQTVPSIDNLIRLKEIFGVSVDELIDRENNIEDSDDLPSESYKFNFSDSELDELNRFGLKDLFKKPLFFWTLSFAILLVLVLDSAPPSLLGFVVGIIFLGSVFNIKGIAAYKKTWKETRDKLAKSSYEYKVYGDHFTVTVCRNGEIALVSNYGFNDIKQVFDVGNFIILSLPALSYVLKKSELSEDSIFYSCTKNTSAKTVRNPALTKWNVISWVLFAGALMSLFAALPLISAVSSMNHLFVENSWIFFLMTPIPIASIVVGFFLKSKGVKYKKNIVAGIIMTVLLCLYGSFSFIFSGFYGHSDEPILRVEQYVGYDIPDFEQITTLNQTKGTQDSSRGVSFYYTSDVYFGSDEAGELKKQIAEDDRWLLNVPSAMLDLVSSQFSAQSCDYVLIYNITDGEFNVLPSQSGEYRFMNVFYYADENRMEISEYSINYVEYGLY